MSGAYQRRVAEIRREYPRAYERWTDEEDQRLEQLVALGQAAEEMAVELQRQPSAIRSRAKKRGLVVRPKRAVKARRQAPVTPRGEVLVAIMNNERDFGILQDQLWYRIPVASAPKRWPPKWLAFYQTKVFGEEAYAVNHYGRVRSIQVRCRRDMFPEEMPNPKSERRYYQIHLERLERLDRAILSRRWRRIVFIPTTWSKFTQAIEINDLYDESPLEDRLWAQLKRQQIAAERQWALKAGKAWYFLDFALFCNDGRLDIETDGDAWHVGRESSDRDNVRDNAVKTEGWQVMRFTGRQIRDQMTHYCMPEITRMINRLHGLSEDGLVSRTYHDTPHGLAQQLTFLEDSADYDLD